MVLKLAKFHAQLKCMVIPQQEHAKTAQLHAQPVYQVQTVVPVCQVLNFQYKIMYAINIVVLPSNTIMLEFAMRYVHQGHT